MLIYDDHINDITTQPLYEEFVSKKLRGYPEYNGKGLKVFPDIDIL